MSRRPGPASGVSVEVLRYLAAGAATWHVLHAYHHQGLAAGVAALGECGGCGRDTGGDGGGVWRSWFVQGRGRVRYQEGSGRAPVALVRLAEVFAWADQQLTAADWASIDQLIKRRGWALQERDEVEQAAATRARIEPGLQPYLAGGVTYTAQERVRLRQAGEAQAGAERELAELLRAAYAAPERAARQLDLFDDPS